MIRLEPIAIVHASALQPLLEDVAIAATTPFASPFPPDGANAYVAETLALQEAGSRHAFAVCEEGGVPLGMSLLKNVDLAIGEAELGYWIGVPYWGRGVATAAAAATLDFAFDTLGLRAVRAVCLEDNPASLRVLAKLGFSESGRAPQNLAKWPEPRISVLLRLTREAWRPMPNAPSADH